MNINSIGNRIRFARKTMGLSRKELAASINISISRLTGIECDKVRPNELEIAQLEQHLNIKIKLKEVGSNKYAKAKKYLKEIRSKNNN